MLKDRVQITESGFKVFHENETRELFYGFFTLKDDPDEDAEMQPTSYWDPVNTFVIPIEKKQCFVEVAEKENGRIVERYRFYFSKTSQNMNCPSQRKRTTNTEKVPISLRSSG